VEREEAEAAGCNMAEMAASNAMPVAGAASLAAAAPAPEDPAAASSSAGEDAAGASMPYFERQVKRWCGQHCLNALEQRAAFGQKELKAFADELFLLCAAIEDNTAAAGRRGRTGRVRAPASHAFGSAVEGNLDVQVGRLHSAGLANCPRGSCGLAPRLLLLSATPRQLHESAYVCICKDADSSNPTSLPSWVQVLILALQSIDRSLSQLPNESEPELAACASARGLLLHQDRGGDTGEHWWALRRFGEEWCVY